MTASAIIPHLKNPPTLPQTLESVRAAAKGLDVEIVCIEDAERRGAAWGRNCGIQKAHGDVLFFVDADDTVAEDFFSGPISALSSTGADLCFFDFEGNRLNADFDLCGNAKIREALLSAFLGYSFGAISRWNAGGSLWQGRELGYIWRTAIRRDFIMRNGIRFDEAMRISDDAAFLCECALYAEKTCVLHRPLYHYAPNNTGIMATSAHSRVGWDEKFAAKAMRKRINEKSGGEAWRHCEASCVLALLEMMATWRKSGLSPSEAWHGLKEYLSDPLVRKAVSEFPLGWRHPLTAAAVTFLRMIAKTR